MNDFIINGNINDTFGSDDIQKIINDIVSENNILTEDLDPLSTRGDGSKQYSLTKYENQMSSIVEKIGSIVEQQLESRNIIPKDTKFKCVNIWTVLGCENGFHKIHRHRPGTISVTIYLSIANSDFHKSGSFYAIINGQTIEHIPKCGDCLIFNDSVLHGSYPQGDGLRQTLNMTFALERQFTPMVNLNHQQG